jgi:hypothetical protein
MQALWVIAKGRAHQIHQITRRTDGCHQPQLSSSVTQQSCCTPCRGGGSPVGPVPHAMQAPWFFARGGAATGARVHATKLSTITARVGRHEGPRRSAPPSCQPLTRSPHWTPRRQASPSRTNATEAMQRICAGWSSPVHSKKERRWPEATVANKGACTFSQAELYC